jgi:hypothetical protein
VPGKTVLGQLPFDDVLGGNAGVVGPGHPQHLEALKPFIPA